MPKNRATSILVGSFLGALIVGVFGDLLVYDPEATDVSEIGFEEGSAGAELVNVAPLILVALGFYGAWKSWEDQN